MKEIRLRRSDGRNALASLALCLAMGAICLAQTTAPVDLSGASLEDLMNIQVTSVSRKEQTLSKTAAAVYVIDSEAIRRSGATNIPDMLRLAPGLDVAQVDANTWAVSIRGFNDRYADKVLVLIDGRTVYSPTNSGVYWDELDVPSEDIDRIEITRGPGGTVWGANAVNGVINIITKSADATRGAAVSAGGGSQGKAEALAQYGGSAGQTGDYRVFGNYSNQGNLTASDSHSAAADGWHMMHGGFRSGWNLSPVDSLTVQGDLINTSEGQSVNLVFANQLPLERTFNDAIVTNSGNILARWTHKQVNGSATTLQVYFDRTDRREMGFDEALDTVDVDLQHHMRIGTRNDVVWGAGYRVTIDHDLPGYDLTFVPLSRTNNLFSTFIQDEIALGNSVSLTAGSRFEHNAYTGFVFEPSVKLLWQATQRQTVWISAARAVTQQSRVEANLQADLYEFPIPGGGFGVGQVTGSPDNTTPERMYDVEGGYRAQMSSRFSLDAAVFSSYYDGLSNLIPGTSFFSVDEGPPHVIVPLVFENVTQARTYGSEVFGTWTVNTRWKLSPSVSAIHLETSNADGGTSISTALDSTPQFQAQVRSSVNLTRRVDWDVIGWHIGHLRDGGYGAVPAYNRLDTRIGWRIRESLELSLVGQNLLTPLHAEFHNSYEVERTLIERSVFGKITWKF